jgi:hypothetical protein
MLPGSYISVAGCGPDVHCGIAVIAATARAMRTGGAVRSVLH